MPERALPGRPALRRAAAVLFAILTSLAGAAGCGPGDPSRDIRNVVLVSIDALGAKHVGCYGYDRETTPTLDGLAEEGALFVNAYTQQTHTLSSHISMLTGLYPQVHGASGKHAASPSATSLTEILKAEGFATAAFTGIGGYAGPQFGLGRGFDVYVTGKNDLAVDNPPRIRWLEEQARLRDENPDHRFFLFAHYYDVHSDFDKPVPYYSPEPYDRLFLPEDVRVMNYGDSWWLFKLQNRGNVSERDRMILTALYDGGVRYTDQEGLGPLVDALKSLGFYENTLLVVTADHGEEIFEHGKCAHQQPYEETARVPLVLRGPGVPAGLRVGALVELVDIMPTTLSLLSLPVPAHVQGQDLTPLLEGKASAKTAAHVDGVLKGTPGGLSALVQEIDGRRWSYIRRVRAAGEDGGTRFEMEGEGELYLLDEDPGQTRNLAGTEPALAGRLDEQLQRWYRENDEAARRLEAPRELEAPLSDEEKEQLRALGYIS